MPNASVIMPVYNGECFIAAAIDSVLAQTYPHWELVVVNDGSTDSTSVILADYVDPRIRIIYQENQGLSAARNTGIRHTQGKFLAFLDADDEWEPRFLEACVSTFSADESATAVVTLARFIDEKGAALPMLGGQTVHSQDFRRRLLEGCFFPVNSVLVRTGEVRRAGLFDEDLTSVEDWDLWLRISANGGKMVSIPEPLARYRISANSMSTNAARMHANFLAVLTKRFGPPSDDPTSWSAEQRQAYGFAYRSGAFGHIQQHEADEGWRLVALGVWLWPDLLQRLDTFYELACGDQSRGYRGYAELLDIEANGADMLQRLDRLFAEADAPVRALRRTAYGNAYLALAMLSDQAGDWPKARVQLLKAIRSNPELIFEKGVFRRFLKLVFLSPKIGTFLKHSFLT